MLRLSCVVHGPIGDLWPFYGLYCKRFFLYINVCYGNDRCFSHTNSYISNVMQQMPMFLNAYISSLYFKRSSKNVFVHVGGLGWSALDSGWWRVARIFCPLLLALAWAQTPQLGEKAKNGVKIGEISAREASPAVAPGFAHQFFFAHADFFSFFPQYGAWGP